MYTELSSLQTDHTYSWLLKTQKEGVALARDTLLERCRRRPAVLAKLLDTATEAESLLGGEYAEAKLNVLYVFVAQIAIGTLSDGSKVSDKLISMLTPNLALGINSSVLPHRQCAQMILCHLVTLVQLTDEIVQNFLTLTLKSVRDEPVTDTPSTSLTTCVILCQRHSPAALPTK